VIDAKSDGFIDNALVEAVQIIQLGKFIGELSVTVTVSPSSS